MNWAAVRASASMHRQRGVVGVVALLFIIIVVLFAMTQAATITSSNLMDSSRQFDSVEALFLAESGIERVGYMFVNDATHTCSDAAIGTGTDYAMGSRGVFRVLGTFTTDFDGSTLPATMCRIRVQGEISSTKVLRTIDTIVGTTDDVISISSLNPNFNDMPYTGSRANDWDPDGLGGFLYDPDNWTLSCATQGRYYCSWTKDGGPDGSRAMFARKTKAGTGTAAAGGAFQTTGTPITITGPKTLRLTFDFRNWTRGSASNDLQFSPRLAFAESSAGSQCSTDSSDLGFSWYCTPAVSVGGDCTNAGTGTTTCNSRFTITTSQPKNEPASGTGCGFTDTVGFESYGDASCPTPPSGSTGYKTGYLHFTVPSGTFTLKSVYMKNADGSGSLQGKDGQITWLWIDNLRLSVPALSGGGPSKIWREVAAP